jgi:hypothetical protein
MPIDSNTIRKPQLVLYEEGATLARDDSMKFMDYSLYPRRYRGGKFPQPGWTPGQQSLDVVDIELNVDNLTITPV